MPMLMDALGFGAGCVPTFMLTRPYEKRIGTRFFGEKSRVNNQNQCCITRMDATIDHKCV